MDILISIIIPVYNCEINVLKRALSSIFALEMEKELIIVNDGSRPELTQQYLNLVNNIDFAHYFYQDNSGVSAARNYGISLSRGKYLLFLDADDEFTAQYIDFLNEHLNQIDADWVLCDIYRVDVLKKQTKTSKLFNNINFNNDKKLYDVSLNEVIQAIVIGSLNECWGKLISRELVVKNNIVFPTGVTLGEDVIFNTRLIGIINRVQYIPLTGYIYYMFSNNLDRSINEGKTRYKVLSERESELTKLIKDKASVEYQEKYLYLQKIKLIKVLIRECCGFYTRKKFNRNYINFIKNWITEEQLLVGLTIWKIHGVREKINYLILKCKMWWVIPVIVKMRKLKYTEIKT